MALLDAKDLGVSSKAFNVFSHLLAELKGGFLLQGSWRKTYVWTKKEDFSPVKVEDFYSDYLFQSWLCASVEIKDEWIFRDNIERRSHLSVDDFVRDFERPNKPVLITHAINDRPALERWNQEYLLELCGDELTSKVVPTIVKLFASTDRAIRASLLQNIDQFFRIWRLVFRTLVPCYEN
ncbi:F-box protein At5g06550 [Selaginella moellendorffii]|uniref:F-box protein At5g06550 n=1 Tax=Selaginella moellendorffii TaxID=88036 RepID=UPI000D1D048C|nr:F-box protein At5g06550 [Selaginella moellendorffii]XP_024540955.1 F-box protein At5g06550 [Selaginella moellendorffii]|eukprot:XP_024540954.1 F-box protein At5g06550 [Selaginella moellendorffii]